MAAKRFQLGQKCPSPNLPRGSDGRRLDDDEKGTTSISTPGGTQELSTVNEPGLYALALGSRKLEAIKRWIT